MSRTAEDLARTTLPRVEGQHSTPAVAFGALLLRDLAVLRKHLVEFILRTVMQPLLFVFVFTYVFPKIGQGVGGAQGAKAFSSLLVPGVVAIACIFQGIQAVALPLVADFGYSREIEDRVMAPLPVWAVGAGKLLAGAIQGVVAALIVFPLAAVVPATPVHLDVRWAELLTVLPLAALVGASLGLLIGTLAPPRQVPLIFGLVVIPITFLGATYYPWASLDAIPWLQALVLVNPLVYMSEGFRIALTPGIHHMPVAAMYAGLLGAIAILGGFGIRGFVRRVQS
ncbi:MAG: type transport system permease protein [Solirubrobacterales bacterium]|jgi:ABC-2 type transport system permease protein|nr:type transport system permease protein [Solirubrobacterales bacterium]